MSDIPTMISQLLADLGSIDIAESEFKRQISDEASLKSQYKEWCEEMDYRERTAFRDYCHEYLDNNESAFDTLTEYDDGE